MIVPRVSVGVLCFSLFALLGGTAGHAAAPALEAYGALPKYDNVELSPSGARLALVQTTGNQRSVAVVSLADGKPISGARVGDEKLRYLEWADEDHLLITRSVTADGVRGKLWLHGEFGNLLIFDVRTGSTLSLPIQKSGQSLVNFVSGQPMIRQIDGHTVLYFTCTRLVMDRSKGAVPVLVRYDLDSGVQRVIRTGGPSFRDWFVDDVGRVSAAVDYDQQSQEWKLSTTQGGEGDDRRIVQTGSAVSEAPAIAGFGPEPSTVLVRMLQDDVLVYRVLNTATGTLSEKNAVPDDAGPIFDRHSHRLIGNTAVADSREYRLSEPSKKNAWDAVTRLFPGARIELVSTSADFRKLVVLVDSRQEGLNYQLADLSVGRVSVIGDVYAGIKTPHEVRALTYKAADGLPIRAYLTLPDGRAPSKLPLVVLVHGGPADRDSARFDWWAQSFASQGYAVLQANYRGSSLGYKFIASGFGEWGRKMQTDVSDGVKSLAEQGIADPARVCIVGGSYGGYAALAGVALQSNIYRCAISVAGPGNLQLMLRYEGNYHSESTQRYWARFMGVTGPNDSAVAKISPYEHVKEVTVPVLLIHGKDDTVVPYQQSETMAEALKRAGKSVELVTLQREDHWLSRPETRLQMLKASVDFLRKHNPPD